MPSTEHFCCSFHSFYGLGSPTPAPPLDIVPSPGWFCLLRYATFHTLLPRTHTHTHNTYTQHTARLPHTGFFAIWHSSVSSCSRIHPVVGHAPPAVPFPGALFIPFCHSIPQLRFVTLNVWWFVLTPFTPIATRPFFCSVAVDYQTFLPVPAGGVCRTAFTPLPAPICGCYLPVTLPQVHTTGKTPGSYPPPRTHLHLYLPVYYPGWYWVCSCAL